MSSVLSSGTVSSNGFQTTTTANQVINFSNIVNSLFIRTSINKITISINGETVLHPIAAGDSMMFNDIRITKISIVESGVAYAYDGAYI